LIEAYEKRATVIGPYVRLKNDYLR
jgi:hypothetical protein